MKVFSCIAFAFCVALVAAENDPKISGKTKRYAPLLPNGIESKLSDSSIPQNLEYSKLQRLYSGYAPNLAYSNIYGYQSPALYSGVTYGSGIASNIVGLSALNGLSQSSLIGSGYGIPSTFSNIQSAYGDSINYETTYGTPQVFQGPIKEGGSTQNVQVRTITQQVPVPVPHHYPVEVTKPVRIPQPYPVDVPKPVPVPVKVEVPVEVPRPYAVRVAQPIPVQVPVNVPVEIPRPYPVTVTKTVQVPIEKPIYVKYPVQYNVPVPAPYSVEVPHPVPVSVPHPVFVKEPQVHVTKSTAYVQPTLRTFSTIQPATYTSVHPTTYTTGLNNIALNAYTTGNVYAGPYSNAHLNNQYSNVYSYPSSYKYVTGQKQYINAQPLNYLRSTYGTIGGLLNSYIPSVYGGYNGLKAYNPTLYSSYNALKTYNPTVYNSYNGLKSYGSTVYGGYNGLKSYTSEYLKQK